MTAPTYGTVNVDGLDVFYRESQRSNGVAVAWVSNAVPLDKPKRRNSL
jgi:hypothetical protein